MEYIDEDRYRSLVKGATVLESDGFGDKVLHLSDGNFIKLFRRKRLISSAALWPYAQRFASNARGLTKKGVPCPSIIGVYRQTQLQRDIVHYRPLAGLTLRQLRQPPQKCPKDLHNKLGSFIAQLHDSGIYFRSAHLGNIVLTPQGELGLIDIADLKIKRRSLGQWKRLRNLRHIFRDKQDRQWLQSHELGSFVEGYHQQSKNLEVSTLEKALASAGQSA